MSIVNACPRWCLIEDQSLLDCDSMEAQVRARAAKCDFPSLAPCLACCCQVDGACS
ncbi:hypothetical protein BDP55DRAFT_683724 [Colletotrichum godetiae]|uniref:Uncharacterized protein n=1 Tax=Colletotrichum godetiae TaxID=1209918 RepID=A0AAJ0A8N3_9PEZI|nr:uncharacterized protein BDP55DRAFT_683724 [Colletotrichum godetiae]KAK1658064.1 hypothetical protein BDP55DRAFT_683724 [Colletotrichum godetiae]